MIELLDFLWELLILHVSLESTLQLLILCVESPSLLIKVSGSSHAVWPMYAARNLTFRSKISVIYFCLDTSLELEFKVTSADWRILVKLLIFIEF